MYKQKTLRPGLYENLGDYLERCMIHSHTSRQNVADAIGVTAQRLDQIFAGETCMCTSNCLHDVATVLPCLDIEYAETLHAKDVQHYALRKRIEKRLCARDLSPVELDTLFAIFPA